MMRCPACWSDKAYRRRKTIPNQLLPYLLLVPMRCHHCYHRFIVFAPVVAGQPLDKPTPVPPRDLPHDRTRSRARSRRLAD